MMTGGVAQNWGCWGGREGGERPIQWTDDNLALDLPLGDYFTHLVLGLSVVDVRSLVIGV